MNVSIVQYKWAGSWGPFKITIPCGECSATEGIIEDVLKTEFKESYEAGKITFTVLPWLDHWWKPLTRGGWHAPIVLINNEVISQGTFIDRGLLGFYIRSHLVEGLKATGNVMYSKPGCPHCARAKEILHELSIPYIDRDIISDPMATHEVFYLCHQFFPKDKPITTPQIWLNGTYIGGADELEKARDEGKLEAYR